MHLILIGSWTAIAGIMGLGGVALYFVGPK